MADVWQFDEGVSRSVSPENSTGAKGAGGMATDGTGAGPASDLGRGWKVSPSIILADGATVTLADLEGSGVIEHIWLTTDHSDLRRLVLSMHWDDQPGPSVEVPLGDFFCTGWPGEVALLSSEMIVVAPACGLNSYWPMPFRRRARITLRNLTGHDVPVYYQVSYVLRDLPGEVGYLHATWRRSNPLGLPAVHTVADGISGRGRYVGTYLAIEPRAPGWWGEGELKFYLDGDQEFPTICGTGTEDYFGGAWNFDIRGQYVRYATPHLGMHQVSPPDEVYQPGQRFGMYRWHTRDPIRFDTDLRVTIQALGWGPDGRYLPLVDADIATTALWYQSEPRAPGNPLPTDALPTTRRAPRPPVRTPKSGLVARLRSVLTPTNRNDWVDNESRGIFRASERLGAPDERPAPPYCRIDPPDGDAQD
jgi:hypothetical protein